MAGSIRGREPELMVMPNQVPDFISPVIDINLVACMHFTRIALAYLVQNATPEDSGFKSITLVSSVAGFKESPGLVSYSASKAGVIGLMRSLRLLTVAQFGVRVNVILPWATDTPMIGQAVRIFRENRIPLNTADDIAYIIQHLSGDVDAHGYSVYCAGGIFVNIEGGLDRTEPQWLGEKHARDLRLGQKTLGEVRPSRMLQNAPLFADLCAGYKLEPGTHMMGPDQFRLFK